LAEHCLIFIIDDDESARAALALLVRSLGLQARSFDSAEEFLKAENLQNSACIISDIQMPGMSGIDLKRYLTARNILTPVIMVTAYAERDVKERALASGAFCVIEKPFDPRVLVDCLERALKLRS
jgi:FixJ family two-component response regulator